jgi:hypothetical protein
MVGKLPIKKPSSKTDNIISSKSTDEPSFVNVLLKNFKQIFYSNYCFKKYNAIN